jgi:general secretion pathway protein N
MTGRRYFLAICAGLGVVALGGLSLAATGPDQPVQPKIERGAIDLDGVAAPKQRRLLGNPLWAIPLSTLSNTRERPLFSPSRRPPAPAVVVVSRVVRPKPVARRAVPERLNLLLIGTVVGETESVGIFLDQTSHQFTRLRTGEGHAGWVLQDVKKRQTTFVKGQQTEILNLPTPQSAKFASHSPN